MVGAIRTLVVHIVAFATVMATIVIAITLLIRFRDVPACLINGPVKTKEQAISMSKEYVRSIAKRENLSKRGFDASIVEHSKFLKRDPTPCQQPPKFHLVKASEMGSYNVSWYAYKKAECDTCWQRLSLSTGVGICGGVYLIGYNRKREMYDRHAASKTKPLCPPAYWPPGPEINERSSN